MQVFTSPSSPPSPSSPSLTHSSRADHLLRPPLSPRHSLGTHGLLLQDRRLFSEGRKDTNCRSSRLPPFLQVYYPSLILCSRPAAEPSPHSLIPRRVTKQILVEHPGGAPCFPSSCQDPTAPSSSPLLSLMSQHPETFYLTCTVTRLIGNPEIAHEGNTQTLCLLKSREETNQQTKHPPNKDQTRCQHLESQSFQPQVSRCHCENITSSWDTMPPAKPSSSATASPDCSNLSEEKQQTIKTAYTDMIEVLKEEMSELLKI